MCQKNIKDEIFILFINPFLALAGDTAWTNTKSYIFGLTRLIWSWSNQISLNYLFWWWISSIGHWDIENTKIGLEIEFKIVWLPQWMWKESQIITPDAVPLNSNLLLVCLAVELTSLKTQKHGQDISQISLNDAVNLCPSLITPHVHLKTCKFYWQDIYFLY